MGNQRINMEATHPSYTTAHEITATVAPFRAWRSSQFIVAREPEWVTIKTLMIEAIKRRGYFARIFSAMQAASTFRLIFVQL